MLFCYCILSPFNTAIYFTRRFVLSLALSCFFIVFFSPFNVVFTSLEEEKANLSAFRRRLDELSLANTLCRLTLGLTICLWLGPS